MTRREIQTHSLDNTLHYPLRYRDNPKKDCSNSTDIESIGLCSTHRILCSSLYVASIPNYSLPDPGNIIEIRQMLGFTEIYFFTSTVLLSYKNESISNKPIPFSMDRDGHDMYALFQYTLYIKTARLSSHL